MKPIANDDDFKRPSPEEFMRMSLDERKAVIEAGIVDDLDTASPEIQAFAERARQRYLATVTN